MRTGIGQRHLAGALLGLLAIGGCHKGTPASTKSESADATTDKDKDKEQNATGAKGGKSGRRGGGPVPIKVAEVVRKVSARSVFAMAPLEGRDQAAVFSKVPGRIAFFGAKEGDPVKVNQTLFRVDRSDPGESYLNAPVLSPIAGWVGRWHVTSLGEQVSPSDAVVTIVDDRALKAIVYLPASDWVEVTPQTHVTATLANLERNAKITTIARAADLNSGRGSITISIDNAKRDWRSGMYARFRFDLSPKERILISSASLIITDTGAFVYTVEGDKARRVPVKFQIMDGDTVEITEGLPPKATIVTAGGNLLGENSTVKIVE